MMKSIQTTHSRSKNTALAAAITALLTIASAPSANAAPASDALSSAFVLPGIYASYNMRNGYRKFDGVSKYQHVESVNPIAVGGYVGKRFPLDDPRWRIQVGADFSWGTAKDDDIYVDLTSGATDVLVGLHSYYWTGGVIAEAQYLFRTYEHTAYISMGPGVHAIRHNSAYKMPNGQHVGSHLDDEYRMGYTLSANLGLGVEYKIGDRSALAFGYAFRFWQTMRYDEATNLFPMGEDFREFLYSHALFLHILIPGLDGKSRFPKTVK